MQDSDKAVGDEFWLTRTDEDAAEDAAEDAVGEGAAGHATEDAAAPPGAARASMRWYL